MLPSVTGCEVPCVTRHQLPAMSYRVTLRCNNAFIKHVQISFYAGANPARGVLLAALSCVCAGVWWRLVCIIWGIHADTTWPVVTLPLPLCCLIRDNAPLLANPTFLVTLGRSLRYAFIIKSIKEYTLNNLDKYTNTV